ncbi:MAG: Flp family type IVb pilin [Acidimicrobiales bacterium]|nr:Flp family type IVb pilin [Acidimicrobiales bacterium]
MRTEESDGEEQNLPDGARPAPSRSRDRGATAVEYALIVALIAGLIVTVVGLVGFQAGDMWQRPVDNLQDEGW